MSGKYHPKKEYSDRFVESPDELPDDDRLWWCDNCGAVFDRHANATDYKFCYNCEQRDAVLIELTPVGKDTEKVRQTEVQH